MPNQHETMLVPRRIWLALIVGIFAATCLPGLVGSEEVKPPRAATKVAAPATGWSTLITPEQLRERSEDDNLLIVDVRSAAEYAAGHIPGAINVPGNEWRTPASKDVAKDGPGQRIFRQSDGSLDVGRYEALLGAAGISAEREIVVYGNRAGKADGSVPAAILLKLGHAKVSFLDGVGLDRWKSAGLPSSDIPVKLPAARYVASPNAGSLWSAEELLKNLNSDDVVIIDSRTAAEFAGDDLRGNKRGGHIPGALLLSSEEFLNKGNGTTISVEAAKAKVEKLIPKGKKVVVYCQSGTRCSHEELILKDLGYDNVILYDASWQEWGNRSDTPVDKSPAPVAPAEPKAEQK
jgi:thiosulfate/3-mercaptopyruvate sulfurtransferase